MLRKAKGACGSGEFNPESLRWGILIGISAALVALFTITNTRFFSLYNAFTIMQQVAPIAIVAIGMTFIIISGGIDLSVGSAVAIVGAVSVMCLNQTNVAGGILGALAAGLVIGLVQGYLIGYWELPSFMVTLGMMVLLRGATLALTRGAPLAVENAVYNYLGGARMGYIPASVIAVVALYYAAHIFLSRSRWGRSIYALGGNEKAARASGIPVGPTRMIAYVGSGLLVGVAAIVTVGRLRSAQPLAGTGLEFEVITAVVLGGASLNGGEGNLIGTFIGAAIVGILSNGLNMVDVSPYYQYVIKGIMVLIAVGLDNYLHTYRLKQFSLQGGAIEGDKGTLRSPDGEKNVLGSERERKRTADTSQVLRMINITKTFPGVLALRDVTFDVKKGEVHALLGENGAGKSTLMKILSGTLQPDRGIVYVDNEAVSISDPIKARRLGISSIHQEFSLIPELTVARNIFLGREPKNRFGLIDAKKMVIETQAICEKLGVEIDAEQRVESLTIGQQQIVEIAKALSMKSWLVIMDEPTSALTESETEKLFELIRQLKSEGVSIVYISHKLEEIFTIADRVTVLRDGQHVSTVPVGDVTHESLVEMMVGRRLDLSKRRIPASFGDVALEVRNLTRKGQFEDISFSVRKGEIVGLAGLLGAGRTEIAKTLFGLQKPDSGEIYVQGSLVRIHSPRKAIQHGIAYVPEDRRREGIIPLLSVAYNITLAVLPSLCRFGLISSQKELALSRRAVDDLGVKTPSIWQRVMNLSGGNQQKVVLGKWLSIKPKVLILDEPTRGIDVGAKAEIHAIIDSLAKQGLAILLISSELPEILALCDRVVVLREGKLTAVYSRDEASQHAIIMSATRG